MLDAEATVVAGHSSRITLPELVGGLSRYDSRRYGDNAITFYNCRSSSPAREAVADIGNIEVCPFNGLVVQTAREAGAVTIIRGLRSGPDFEYECQMFFMNRRLEPDVDMVSLMSDQEHTFISSSLLKEVAQLGGNISDMVPPNVANALAEKFPATGGPQR